MGFTAKTFSIEVVYLCKGSVQNVCHKACAKIAKICFVLDLR